MPPGDHDIQRVSDGEQDDLSVILRVHRRAEREVCLIDPASLLDDAFALEAGVLQRNVECELHPLVRACRHTREILQVLAQECVARARVTCVADGLGRRRRQEARVIGENVLFDVVVLRQMPRVFGLEIVNMLVQVDCTVRDIDDDIVGIERVARELELNSFGISLVIVANLAHTELGTVVVDEQPVNSHEAREHRLVHDRGELEDEVMLAAAGQPLFSNGDPVAAVGEGRLLLLLEVFNAFDQD